MRINHLYQTSTRASVKLDISEIADIEKSKILLFSEQLKDYGVTLIMFYEDIAQFVIPNRELRSLLQNKEIIIGFMIKAGIKEQNFNDFFSEINQMADNYMPIFSAAASIRRLSQFAPSIETIPQTQINEDESKTNLQNR